jgi:hypothetical protein
MILQTKARRYGGHIQDVAADWPPNSDEEREMHVEDVWLPARQRGELEYHVN